MQTVKSVVPNLDAKLKRLARAHEKKLIGYADAAKKQAKNATDRHNWSFQYLKRAEKPLEDLLPLKFKKRARVFENYKASCGFNPANGWGHSYRWYELTKVIRGKLVLNTYNYSSCTTKHVAQVRRLLDLLKVDYVSIEAPRGLQDLEAATLRTAEVIARAAVENKYARKPSKYSAERAKTLLESSKAIGLKVTQARLKTALDKAEADRTARLEKQRTKRALAKQQAKASTPNLALLQGGAA